MLYIAGAGSPFNIGAGGGRVLECGEMFRAPTSDKYPAPIVEIWNSPFNLTTGREI